MPPSRRPVPSLFLEEDIELFDVDEDPDAAAGSGSDRSVSRSAVTAYVAAHGGSPPAARHALTQLAEAGEDPRPVRDGRTSFICGEHSFLLASDGAVISYSYGLQVTATAARAWAEVHGTSSELAGEQLAELARQLVIRGGAEPADGGRSSYRDTGHFVVVADGLVVVGYRFEPWFTRAARAAYAAQHDVEGVDVLARLRLEVRDALRDGHRTVQGSTVSFRDRRCSIRIADGKVIGYARCHDGMVLSRRAVEGYVLLHGVTPTEARDEIARVIAQAPHTDGDTPDRVVVGRHALRVVVATQVVMSYRYLADGVWLTAAPARALQALASLPPGGFARIATKVWRDGEQRRFGDWVVADTAEHGLLVRESPAGPVAVAYRPPSPSVPYDVASDFAASTGIDVAAAPGRLAAAVATAETELDPVVVVEPGRIVLVYDIEGGSCRLGLDRQVQGWSPSS